jgi:hypothetical protein
MGKHYKLFRDLQNIFYAFDELDVGGLIINDVPIYRIDHSLMAVLKSQALVVRDLGMPLRR